MTKVHPRSSGDTICRNESVAVTNKHALWSSVVHNDDDDDGDHDEWQMAFLGEKGSQKSTTSQPSVSGQKRREERMNE
jgi:hypothetical protein